MGIPNPRPVPHLMVRDAAPVIAFYTDVFEAVPIERECLLDGRVLHAELAVGGHRLAVSEWYDGPGAVAADGPVVLTVAPDDPQLLLKRALAAGAELEAAADGAVDAVFRDPAGQRWSVVGASRPE